MGRMTGCLLSFGRMWYSRSSVRNKYCGHNFSFEETLVTPTDPHTAPNPFRPFCFMPHGNDCMLSIMPRGGFFLSLAAALVGSSIDSASAPMTNMVAFIEASSLAVTAL